jgi:hypothetical protein
MISVDRVIPRSVQVSYVGRNSGTSKDFHSFAKTQTAVGSSKAAIESSWLIAKGGSGAGLNAQWGSYLTSKGFTTGTLKERMLAFFKTGTQA